MNAPIEVVDQPLSNSSPATRLVPSGPHVPSNSSTCADREAWIDRAERDLAAMRAYLAELERRWAGIKSEFASLNTAEQQKRSA